MATIIDTSNPHSDNLYERLGIEQDASQREIKNAYQRLIKKWHPDVSKCDSTEIIKQIFAANEILNDPAQRARYDSELKSKTFQTKPTYNSAAFNNFYKPPGGFSAQAASSAKPKPDPTPPKESIKVRKLLSTPPDSVEKNFTFNESRYFYLANLAWGDFGAFAIDYVSAKDLGIDSYEGLEFRDMLLKKSIHAYLSLFTRADHEKLSMIPFYKKITLTYTKKMEVITISIDENKPHSEKRKSEIIERAGRVEVYLEWDNFRKYEESLKQI